MLIKGLEIAKEYADTVVKGALSEFGGILSDQVAYWRLKNQVRLMLKAKQYLEEKGIQPSKMLPDVFVPLLEDGGNVEDATLSEMFASLLASHLDPTKQSEVHPSFTKVLVQLSPFDANLIIAFRGHVSDNPARMSGLRGHVLSVNDMAQELSIPLRTAYLSCLNLTRLGLIEHLGYHSPEDHPVPSIFETDPANQLHRMSEYGVAFCDACHYQSG